MVTRRIKTSAHARKAREKALQRLLARATYDWKNRHRIHV